MKKRPLRRSRADVAAPPLRCAGLRSATAALKSNCSSVPGAKGLQEGIGKSVGEWHFTLRERQTSVGTNELSPKEATQMSYDVKYIGYVELETADIMWPSGLYRVGPGTESSRQTRVRLDELRSLTCST
jgi:hypothetical protein